MDKKFAVHRTPALENLERRVFLKRSLSLGALAMLTGCELTDQEGVQRVLMAMSSWNDGVQHWLFNPNRLAPDFAESRITPPSPYNGYYGEDEELPPNYGYPMKLRSPTKLGFKNPKLIAAIFVTNEYPGGYWEDKGYNWYSGS